VTRIARGDPGAVVTGDSADERQQILSQPEDPRPCEPDSTGRVGSSSQNGVSTEPMLREPTVDPVSFSGKAGDVELGKRSDHLADGEPRLAHELVRRRRQEVE
jgi:hypothetical protein